MVAEDPSLWPRASFDTRAYVIDVSGNRARSAICATEGEPDYCASQVFF